MYQVVLFLIFCTVNPDNSLMCSEDFITVDTIEVEGLAFCESVAAEHNDRYVKTEKVYINPSDDTLLLPKAMCRPYRQHE